MHDGNTPQSNDPYMYLLTTNYESTMGGRGTWQSIFSFHFIITWFSLTPIYHYCWVILYFWLLVFQYLNLCHSNYPRRLNETKLIMNQQRKRFSKDILIHQDYIFLILPLIFESRLRSSRAQQELHLKLRIQIC